MIDVVITSDIRIYCEGLGQILARTTDVNIVGVANTFEGALDAVTDSAPDVLLLDMTMADSCNLACHLSQVSPQIKIVALAVSYDEGNIIQCAEAGVTCYVPREASINELVEAMREAAKGECYCPPKIAACILHKVQNLASSAKNRYMPFTTSDPRRLTESARRRQTCLTQREQQIASLLVVGLSNKEIARDLSIEVSTVKNHVHNVLVKLEVSNRSQAVFSLQERSLFPGSESMDLDPV